MRPKMFFLLLALCAVLFAGSSGVAIFSSNGGGGNDDSFSGKDVDADGLQEKLDGMRFPPKWLAAMNSLITKRVKVADIETSGDTEAWHREDVKEKVVLVFDKTGRCELSFRDSKTKVRNLEVELIRGRITVTQPVEDEEGKSERKSVDLPTKKNSVRLSCAIRNGDVVTIECRELEEVDAGSPSGADQRRECRVQLGK